MLCAWLALGSHAAGQSVALDMRACAEPAPRDVRAVLTVELHEQLLGEAEAVPADARLVEVRCTRDQAELWLRGTGLGRTLALASVPAELRARLLALSVAELTRPQPTAAGVGPRASGQESSPTPATDTRAGFTQSAGSTRPQPMAADGAARPADSTAAKGRIEAVAGQASRAGDPQPSEAAAREAAAMRERQSSSEAAAPEAAPLVGVAALQPPRFLWLGAEVQATPLLGLGGALLFRATLVPWLAWSSALSLGEAHTNIDSGKLRVLSASLRTGLAWLAQGRRGSFHAGAGVRGRWLRLSGEPSNAASTAARHFDAWSLGPALFAGASVRIAAPVFLALELELQHALREVTANVEAGSPRTLSPWRTSAVVGAGWAW